MSEVIDPVIYFAFRVGILGMFFGMAFYFSEDSKLPRWKLVARAVATALAMGFLFGGGPYVEREIEDYDGVRIGMDTELSDDQPEESSIVRKARLSAYLMLAMVPGVLLGCHRRENSD